MRRLRSHAAVCSVVSATLSMVGCQSYRPAPTSGPAQATAVRVWIDSSAVDMLAPKVGVRPRYLLGEWRGTEGGESLVALHVVGDQSGLENPRDGSVVRLPAGSITRIDAAQRSPKRTAMLVGAVAAGSALFIALLRAIGGRSSGTNDGGGGPIF